MTTPNSSRNQYSDEAVVFTCWKDIARYMGKGVRTVQRWEQGLGLPVRRPLGASHKSAVLASRQDLDAWIASRWSCRNPPVSAPYDGLAALRISKAELSERIRAAQELRDANHSLIKELHEALHTLLERCALLAKADDLMSKQVIAPCPVVREAASIGTHPGNSSSKRIA